MFEPADKVRLGVNRLVKIGDIERLDSFEIHNPEILSQVLAVNA